MVANKRIDGESKTATKTFDDLFIPAATELADDIGLTLNDRDELIELLREDQQGACVRTHEDDDGVWYTDDSVSVGVGDRSDFIISDAHGVNDPRYDDSCLMQLIHDRVAVHVTGDEYITAAEDMYVYCIEFNGGSR